MNYYDTDKDGNITYEEFLRGLRDELSDRKKKMVVKAFKTIDRDGSGVVTVSDVAHLYDCQQHPDFKKGKKTKEQIIGEFLDNFDGAQGNNDGRVTLSEFMDYYTDLSMSLPSAQYFVALIESTWGVCEDEDSQIFKDQIMRVVSLMRNRLLDISNGSQEEYVLRKLFQDFDTNKSGNLTIDELAAMIAKLGVSVDRKFLSGLMKEVDKNNNGAVEYEEFANFMIFDPYK